MARCESCGALVGHTTSCSRGKAVWPAFTLPGGVAPVIDPDKPHVYKVPPRGRTGCQVCGESPAAAVHAVTVAEQAKQAIERDRAEQDLAVSLPSVETVDQKLARIRAKIASNIARGKPASFHVNLADPLVQAELDAVRERDAAEQLANGLTQAETEASASVQGLMRNKSKGSSNAQAQGDGPRSSWGLDEPGVRGAVEDGAGGATRANDGMQAAASAACGAEAQEGTQGIGPRALSALARVEGSSGAGDCGGRPDVQGVLHGGHAAAGGSHQTAQPLPGAGTGTDQSARALLAVQPQESGANPAGLSKEIARGSASESNDVALAAELANEGAPAWITFDGLVAWGLQQCRLEGRESNIVRGMPWSFTWCDLPISHENDRCYCTPLGHLEPGDRLVQHADGRITLDKGADLKPAPTCDHPRGFFHGFCVDGCGATGSNPLVRRATPEEVAAFDERMAAAKAPEACATCRFANDGGFLRNCRRHAPTLDAPTGRAVWPVVEASDWCGEYQRKEA
jgi:hypothetical protein